MISLGDDATQAKAMELHKNLVTSFTLDSDTARIGQVSGDVLAEIRADASLCASFLYLVGSSFKGFVEALSQLTGVDPALIVVEAFTDFEAPPGDHGVT